MHVKTYHWLHIPTGETGFRDFDYRQALAIQTHLFDDGLREMDALRLVNAWNQRRFSGETKGIWLYWIEDSDFSK